MPNGDELKWWQDDPDWKPFRSWQRAAYGWTSWFGRITYRNFRQSAEYKLWVSQGKPTAEKWRAQKARGEYLTMPWEERPAKVRAEVRNDPEALSKGLLPPPTEGYEWQWQPNIEGIWDPAQPKGQWNLKPIEAPEGPSPKGRIERMDGNLVWVEYDADGNIITAIRIGAADDPEAQARAEAFEREQFEWQKGEATRARAFQKAQLAQQSAIERERILAGLTGPRDWIQYWLYRNVTMPQARASEMMEEASSLLGSVQGLPGGYWTEDETGRHFVVPPGAEQRTQAEMQSMRLEEQAADIMRRTAGLTPPSPEWLPEHLIGAGVPGAGQPIQRLPVRTPSPQHYTGMAPTAQLGLAGYADWAAPESRTWLDILGHYKQMLPEEVQGGRFAQWRPIRQ